MFHSINIKCKMLSKRKKPPAGFFYAYEKILLIWNFIKRDFYLLSIFKISLCNVNGNEAAKIMNLLFSCHTKTKKCYELASFFNGYRLYLVNISNSNSYNINTICRKYLYKNTCLYPQQMDTYYAVFAPSISSLAHGNIFELYFACHSLTKKA